MGLGKWEVYSLLLNANIGAGVMLLPAVFQRSGIVAALIVLVTLGVVSWLLQVELVVISNALSEDADSKDLTKPLLSPKVTNYQWDLPEIVHLQLGSLHSSLYFLLYYLAITSALSAYANLTGTAIGTLLFQCDYATLEVAGECMQSYHHGLIIYFVVVCFLTLLDYKEQAWLQTIMTGSRYTLIALIFCYAIYKGSLSGLTVETAVFNTISDLGIAISVLVFTCFYQMCSPSIIHDSHITQHEHDTVARWVSVSTVGLYALLGFAGLVMPGLPDNISLLFAKETYGYSAEAVPVLLQIVNWMVICIPVLDVWANSPIFGQSLAGIWITSLYGPNHTQVRNAHPFLYRAVRCLVLCPPTLMAALSHRLVTSTQGPVVGFAGNFFIPMVIIYIPLCYNVAKQKLHLKWTWRGIEVTNYLISSIGTVGFFYLLYTQLF